MLVDEIGSPIPVRWQCSYLEESDSLIIPQAQILKRCQVLTSYSNAHLATFSCFLALVTSFPSVIEAYGKETSPFIIYSILIRFLVFRRWQDAETITAGTVTATVDGTDGAAGLCSQ